MTKIFLRATAATTTLLMSVSGASAVGFLTQMNCASDYYAYCSQFSVGTPEVRSCMRRAGPRLSKSCLNALIADGEVSKAEVEQKRQQIHAAKAKSSAPEKSKVEAQKSKQKAISVAKGDGDQKHAESRRVRTASTKATSEREVAPANADKLRLDQQTFAALKQRQSKFVEVAMTEEAPRAPDPKKSVSSKVADPALARSVATHQKKTTASHRKTMVQKHRAEKVDRGLKAKTKLAAKKSKQSKNKQAVRKNDTAKGDPAKRVARN